MRPVTVAVISSASILCTDAAIAQYSADFDTDNAQWTTWVSSGYEPLIGHSATGGVNGTGHVFVDLAGINFEGPLGPPNDFIYWSAYLYADDLGLDQYDFSNASVRVSAFGDSVDLQSGQLSFYVGRYDAATGFSGLYRTAEAVVIGDALWAMNDLMLDSGSWVEMLSNGFDLEQTLAGATEFGFVVTGVQQFDDDPSGILRLDSFSTDALRIPAPGVAFPILAGALVPGRRRR